VPTHPLHPDELAPLADGELVGMAQQLHSRGGGECETARRCIGLVLVRHRNLMRAVIAAKVPASAVDDLESDVFARFAAKVYTGAPITNPAGLVVRMAMFVRADFHAGRRPAEASLEDWDDAGEDPALADAAVAAAVEELLSPLSERQREAVRLRIVEGRPSAEVASALGTTAGNVDVIVHRALTRMREALG
jgi:RNA polymerase sigma factor (sigma-70 family)